MMSTVKLSKSAKNPLNLNYEQIKVIKKNKIIIMES